MLEELLKHDKLGNKNELFFVLFQVLHSNKKHRLVDIKKFCISNLFSISRSFNGILSLLEFLSFIRIEDGEVTVCQDVFGRKEFLHPEEYFEKDHFFNCLLDKLIRSNVFDDFFSEKNLKFSNRSNQYYVKEQYIPFRFFPIRNLFLSLGFLVRDPTLHNHLLIDKKFSDLFKSIIIDNLQDQKNKRKISIGELRKRNEQKEEIGKQAELFVLQYEKNRLSKHLNNEKIKRISEEFVNAGYDIESFDDLDSFIVDRFIEVKSYEKEISFFWSRNEVQKAQELNEKYYLYLVDRLLMKDEKYIPRVFQNPYEKIFKNELWKKETENWKVTVENS